jgi:hypothetical protein
MGFLWFKSRIEKVLDAYERHGALAGFSAEVRQPDRLKSLTAIECAKVLERLEKLSKKPPAGQSYNDHFNPIAGLLDSEGSSVDLGRLDQLIDRIPAEHQDRRESLYRVLGRLQTRESLDRLMRRVESNPADPALKEVWSALITTVRDPKHKDILFPRLAILLARTECAGSVMEIANAFTDPPHPLKDHAPRLLDFLEHAEDEDLRSAAAWTLGLIGHVNAADALAAAASGGGGRLPVEAAQALLRLGDPRGSERIATMCGNPRLRWRCIEYLKEIGRQELIPVALRSPDIDAEDQLRRWLEHGMEYGKPPEEVHLLDASRRPWPGKGVVDCWLFRYRYGDAWGVGMSGPVVFSLSQDLDGQPIEQIYQAYQKWDTNPERGGPAFQKLADQVMDEGE